MNDAFLWETEALRARYAARRNAPTEPPAMTGMVTVRQASDATGIPTDTVRKWAMKGRIPSEMRGSNGSTVRYVDLEGVRRTARDLGRDVRDERRPDPTNPIPEGSILVPVAAWDRMLNQLGNLHEAGQQLADARERAARAETEAAFLRERLSELRGKEAPAAAPTPEPMPEPSEQVAPVAQPAANPPTARRVWNIVRSEWGRRRR